MPATNMYRVTQIGVGVAGTPDYITGYFDVEGGTAQQAATAWNAVLAGTSPGEYVTPYRFESIINVDIVDPVTGDVVGQAPVNVGGTQFTATGGPLPPATSFMMGWRTGVYVNGREIRGRTNVSRLPATRNVSGAPDSGFLAGRQGLIQALLTSSVARLVVYSPTHGRWEQVVSGYASPQWKVLRSRRD